MQVVGLARRENLQECGIDLYCLVHKARCWLRRLRTRAARVIFYVPYTTISVNDRAIARLRKNKLPGDTYSDVILRELPDPADTLGELLDCWEHEEGPKANPKLRAAMLSGRGRRSNRPAPRK